MGLHNRWQNVHPVSQNAEKRDKDRQAPRVDTVKRESFVLTSPPNDSAAYFSGKRNFECCMEDVGLETFTFWKEGGGEELIFY